MKPSVLLIVFFSCLFSGCGKIDELTKFKHEKNQTIEIPSFIGIDVPFEIEIRELGFTFTKNYSLEGYKKHFVEHARLSALEVSVLSPSSGDFSFLESTIIYISADGLPELEIARKNDEPGDFGHFISLDVNDYDLRDYIKKDEFILKVKIVFDEIILQDHEINIRSVFDIDARVMGV